ncbi:MULTISPECIES: hypothetical protein [unclassified Paenibacillus]|uniref:hypothetical protein n=1 Tax=unclassified Paenibacillus TaxID=185978 RepID=UPI0009568551|nr:MULTISPECIES: hypothetical protein [unclassified Paenibacillus]ASS68591.1 hypothetical protein CIC07_22480 [Paenibacillus sp. RUD330]SIR64178.1 hypothetical protein SAMN05880555_4554 [Paenibacillus sp. RU4X]SIR72280.1 hypothetical protein SAMN05880570_4556 [Paenibacillus sp. RU4T]
MPDATDLSHQVDRREEALQADTPEEAVRTWIRGVQKRSGAMQYAIMSPSPRQAALQEFKDHYEVTGGSSPHMGEAGKLEFKVLGEDKTQISFEYPLIVMNESIDTGKAVLTAERFEKDGCWTISKIALKDAGDTGTMIGADQLRWQKKRTAPVPLLQRREQSFQVQRAAALRRSHAARQSASSRAITENADAVHGSTP